MLDFIINMSIVGTSALMVTAMIIWLDNKEYYKENSMCGCGRSPREDGKCVGFHKLSEEVWNERKEVLVEEYLKGQDSSVGRAAD